MVREVEESGQERAEGEVERERKSTPNGPGDVRLITARGKGRSKAPAKKRPLEKRHGSAGLEATSQSGSQQERPMERGLQATESSGPRERVRPRGR